jgi:cell wall-associated NlpC family hydrolase
MTRTTVRAWVLVALLSSVAVQVAFPRPALSQVDAKRAEAAALQAKIAEQGRKLSLADEEFNQARIERQSIENQAASTRAQVSAAEKRWGVLRDQLSSRVRLLYMHPGAAIDAWLSQRSLNDLTRARKLGSSVLTADTELVMKTEKARQELLGRANRLEGLRDAAAGKEQEIASHRAEVSSAVAGQRQLLGQVNGEIAQLMAAERQAAIEAARRQATRPSEEADETSTPPIIGDSDSNDDDPVEEDPVGPPPPVKGGAGTAVSAAAAQIGKPYEWAAEGPDSFDCSGLTMYAWGKAGVSMPHSSRAQFASFPKVSKKDLRPGDLVFYGNPIHHVGIYEGGGTMINAPETGQNVRRDSIHRADWAGAVRP